MFNNVNPLINALAGSSRPYNLTDYWGNAYESNYDKKTKNNTNQ